MAPPEGDADQSHTVALYFEEKPAVDWAEEVGLVAFTESKGSIVSQTHTAVAGCSFSAAPPCS